MVHESCSHLSVILNDYGLCVVAFLQLILSSSSIYKADSLGSEVKYIYSFQLHYNGSIVIV